MNVAAHSILDLPLVGQGEVLDVAFLLFEYCHIFRFKEGPVPRVARHGTWCNLVVTADL